MSDNPYAATNLEASIASDWFVGDRPVSVYEARSALQAYALRNLLADHGIEARVNDFANLEMGVGGIGRHCELWVASSDVECAVSVLSKWEQDSRERTSLKPSKPLQFGIALVLANITVFAFVFAIVAIAATPTAKLAHLYNFLFALLTGILGVNLMYIAYRRRRQQTFVEDANSDERPDASAPLRSEC